MDAALFAAVNGAHAPWLDAVMVWASWLGYFPGIWFLAPLAALCWPRVRAAAFQMCLAVSLAYALNSGVVKPLVARDRPYMTMAVSRTVERSPADGYSFPSGHAATAVAGAIAGARVVPSASPVLWALATLMAASRIYVGVHYPSDIMAGGLLGAACAYLVLGGRRHRAIATPVPPGVVVRP